MFACCCFALLVGVGWCCWLLLFVVNCCCLEYYLLRFVGVFAIDVVGRSCWLLFVCWRCVLLFVGVAYML